MPLLPEDFRVVPLVSYDKMADAVLQVAEGLAIFALELEAKSKLGPLPDELHILAHEIRKPVLRTLLRFQAVACPDDPIERIETTKKRLL